MTPRLRKFALLLHISSSVGWLGAVASFLVFAIVGLTYGDPQLVRASYISMEVITSFIIVPLSLASLITGVLQALGTKWGLFRHYWVLVKLLITFLATVVLFIHTQPIQYLADMAVEAPLLNGELRSLQIQMVVDAGAALVVLFITTILSVYKPQGLTVYGWRKQQEQRALSLEG
jgi:uncharacterized membrane protein